MRDRGGKFGHCRQAQGAGQLRLGIAQGPLGGLALGHFGLERRVGVHQFGGALPDRRFERLLGAPPLHAPGQGHQRENDKCRKGRQIDRGDLDVVSRRRPEIRRRDRRQCEGQQARSDPEPCPGDDGRIEWKGRKPAGSDFEQDCREVGGGGKDNRQPVSGGREPRGEPVGQSRAPRGKTALFADPMTAERRRVAVVCRRDRGTVLYLVRLDGSRYSSGMHRSGYR